MRAIEIRVPLENVNDSTARLLRWRVVSDGSVSVGQPVAELETAKATFDIDATAEGRLERLWKEGDEVPVGEVLCRIHPPEVESPSPTVDTNARSPGPDTAPKAVQIDKDPAVAAPVAVPATAEDPGVDPFETIFSQKAEAAIKANGLTPAAFAGLDFVTEQIVLERYGVRAAEVSGPVIERGRSPKPSSGARRPTPHEATFRELDRRKLYENRELAAAQADILRSSISFLCPADQLEALAKQQGEPMLRVGILISETARLLRKYEMLNGYHAEGGYHKYPGVHIGLAVELGRGLKVLTVRDADILTIGAIIAKVKELLVGYALDSLGAADISGSTFTISDLTQEGVHSFDPLINTRQAGILGVGAEQTIGGEAAGFLLTCAFDHRVPDGRYVAGFLRELSARLVVHRDSLRGSGGGAGALHCSRCLRTLEDMEESRGFLLKGAEQGVTVCSLCLLGY